MYVWRSVSGVDDCACSCTDTYTGSCNDTRASCTNDLHRHNSSGSKLCVTQRLGLGSGEQQRLPARGTEML